MACLENQNIGEKTQIPYGKLMSEKDSEMVLGQKRQTPNSNFTLKRMKINFMSGTDLDSNRPDLKSSMTDFEERIRDLQTNDTDFESSETDFQSKETISHQYEIKKENNPEIHKIGSPNSHKLKSPKYHKTPTKTFIHAYKDKWEKKLFQIETGRKKLFVPSKALKGSTESKTPSAKPKLKGRTCDKVFNKDLLLLPLLKGWKRELVSRAGSTVETGIRRDVYYFSPCGAKLRSSKELEKFLIEKACSFTKEHFSFAQIPMGFGEPYEMERNAAARVCTGSPRSAKKTSPTKVRFFKQDQIKTEKPPVSSESSHNAVPDSNGVKEVVHMEQLSEEDTLPSSPRPEEGGRESNDPMGYFNLFSPPTASSLHAHQSPEQRLEGGGSHFLSLDEFVLNGDIPAQNSTPRTKGDKPQLPVFQLRIGDDFFEEEEEEVMEKEKPDASFLDYTSVAVDGDQTSSQEKTSFGQCKFPASAQSQAKIRVRSLDELCGSGSENNSVIKITRSEGDGSNNLLDQAVLRNQTTMVNNFQTPHKIYKINFPGYKSYSSPVYVTLNSNDPTVQELTKVISQNSHPKPVYTPIGGFPNPNLTTVEHVCPKLPIPRIFNHKKPNLVNKAPKLCSPGNRLPNSPMLPILPSPPAPLPPAQPSTVIKVCSKRNHMRANHPPRPILLRPTNAALNFSKELETIPTYPKTAMQMAQKHYFDQLANFNNLERLPCEPATDRLSELRPTPPTTPSFNSGPDDKDYSLDRRIDSLSDNDCIDIKDEPLDFESPVPNSTKELKPVAAEGFLPSRIKSVHKYPINAATF